MANMFKYTTRLLTNSCNYILGLTLDYISFNPPSKRRFVSNHRNIEILSEQGISYAIIRPDSIYATEKYIIFSHSSYHDIASLITKEKKLMEWPTHLSANLVLYDYYGYGMSEGRVLEDKCYISLDIVINKLMYTGVNCNNILLVGHELGASVVVDYVRRIAWTKPIVLISAYKSLMSTIINYCAANLGAYGPEDKFVNVHKIEKITCPVRFYHGEDDKKVPIYHSKFLYKLIKENNADLALEPVWLQGTSHIETLNSIDISSLSSLLMFKVDSNWRIYDNELDSDLELELETRKIANESIIYLENEIVI